MKPDNHTQSSSPCLDRFKAYLRKREVVFKDRDESTIVIPTYGDESHTAEIVISHSCSQDIVTIFVGGVIPADSANLLGVLDQLNLLNHSTLMGSYLVCPCCSRLGYRLGLYLPEEQMTDAYLGAVLEGSFNAYLKCAKLAPAAKEGGILEPAPTDRSG